jgi:peptide methionine sulfoxide reductase msrA/msrB
MEWIFEAQDWVKEAIVWYAWWDEKSANYNDVSTWMTKHKETVKVIYDPSKISYEKLVKLYFTQIDPTNHYGQFADIWPQYETAVIYIDDLEKNIAEKYKEDLEDSKKFNKPIVVQIIPFINFFPAEEYHQNYYIKKSLHYSAYKKWSWREWFIENNWKDEILKQTLTPLQYEVTQNADTERPFENEYFDNFEEWIYIDIVDWTPLFSSKDKFESHCGWPSFSKPVEEELIEEKDDDKLFMKRTEVISNTSNSHLWHVFTDWPQELGWLRYCINSASLKFIPKEKMDEMWYGDYMYLLK